MTIKNRHIGIALIVFFYYLIALSVTALFLYTYLTTDVVVLDRIFGIILGCILGSCIFFIGFSVWKGRAWAQLVVLVVSAIIVIFNIIAYVIGRVVTVGSAVYLIVVLAVNVLIIKYLFGKHAKNHFYKNIAFKNAIQQAIQKHYEEHHSDNQE